MNGFGTSRRAGFHFFADQPGSSNRGNSYFVWFRLDDDKIQIYKVINNSWGSAPVKDTAFNFVSGQEYDVKIIYDRITGLIRVYINNIFSAQWVDTNPIQNGSYISFRNANCNYQVDDFYVFRSRYPTATISIGNGNMNDIRYQNTTPFVPAGKIMSVVSDNAGNLSSVAEQWINVDWTPSSIISINYGFSNDIDTISNVLIQANWTPSYDSNSDIEHYEIAIGTNPNGIDVLGWTSIGQNLFLSMDSLILINGQTYFVSVRAINNAGLYADESTTDGQIYLLLQYMKDSNQANYEVFPNPCNSILHIQLNPSSKIDEIILTDVNGKILKVMKCFKQQTYVELKTSELEEGSYCLWYFSNSKKSVKKIIVKH